VIRASRIFKRFEAEMSIKYAVLRLIKFGGVILLNDNDMIRNDSSSSSRTSITRDSMNWGWFTSKKEIKEIVDVLRVRCSIHRDSNDDFEGLGHGRSEHDLLKALIAEIDIMEEDGEMQVTSAAVYRDELKRVTDVSDVVLKGMDDHFIIRLDKTPPKLLELMSQKEAKQRQIAVALASTNRLTEEAKELSSHPNVVSESPSQSSNISSSSSSSSSSRSSSSSSSNSNLIETNMESMNDFHDIKISALSAMVAPRMRIFQDTVKTSTFFHNDFSQNFIVKEKQYNFLKFPEIPTQSSKIEYPPAPKWPPQERYRIENIVIHTEDGKLGIELRGTPDDLQQLIIQDIYKDGAANKCNPSLVSQDHLIEIGGISLENQTFGNSIALIMDQIKKLNGRLPIVVSRKWPLYGEPEHFNEEKYLKLRKDYDLAMIDYNEKVKEIDLKNGHEYGEKMRLYKLECDKISIANKKLEKLKQEDIIRQQEEIKKEKNLRIEKIEYEKIRNDMKLLCHVLPSDVYLIESQKLKKKEKALKLSNEIEGGGKFIEMKSSSKTASLSSFSPSPPPSSFFSSSSSYSSSSPSSTEITTNSGHISLRKQAAKETALQVAMAELDEEENTEYKNNQTDDVKMIQMRHQLGLIEQRDFVKRIDDAKTVMDLLQCILDIEELVANVDYIFNKQQIRRRDGEIHTNYVMLPLFPTPVPDNLMKTPQLSMVAAKLYNLEYAFRFIFTPEFEAKQYKKYYKKKKPINYGVTKYNIQKTKTLKKCKSSQKKPDDGHTTLRGNGRGALTPAEFGGLLTIDGQPIEICTTCDGKNTRKNGSNRGKLQRWCVDCQKSYRVRDALTPLQHKEKQKMMLLEVKKE
jgi:hypothetical protein